MICYKCQEGWETLKDHPIDLAGDLKHRPISGGAPKNAFLFLCKLAISDGSFTIGFTGGKNCTYPKTVLNKNRLDEKKPIIRVIPSIKAHK